MMVNGDSTGRAPLALIFKRFRNGSDSTWSTEFPAIPSVPPMGAMGAIPPMPAMPSMPELPPMHFKFDTAGTFIVDNDKVIIVNSDSVLVRNGENTRTVIRITNDTTGPDRSTRVIVISKSRKGAEQPQATRKIDTIGTPSSVSSSTSENVRGYLLGENIPNPFSQTTTITFTLGKPGKTALTVFDATGKVVKSLVDAYLPAGTHTATLDATDLPSGIYLYRLVSGSFSQTRTMTLQK
jgi:hypothetical protein